MSNFLLFANRSEQALLNAVFLHEDRAKPERFSNHL